MPGRVARGPLALFFVLIVIGVDRFELIRIKPELLRLEHGDEKILALGIVRLHELLVDLIDHLLQLVVREIDLEEERAVDLEAAVMKIDAADAPRATVDREDLARFGADGALEA